MPIKALLPEGMTTQESLPYFIEGVFGGTICGIGAAAISLLVAPDAAAALVSTTAMSAGFATTFAMHTRPKTPVPDSTVATAVSTARRKRK
ncbi:MAG: hypothetical protein AB1468_02310 [Candidatus Micrarchaeota archaeon]